MKTIRHKRNGNIHAQTKKNNLNMVGGNRTDIAPLLRKLRRNDHLLPIHLETYGILAFAVICQDNETYTATCEEITAFLKTNDLNFEPTMSKEIPNVSYVWFFHGTQFYLYPRRFKRQRRGEEGKEGEEGKKEERGEPYYTISVEFNPCMNFGLARDTYVVKNDKTGIYTLNVFGHIVFNILLKYTSHPTPHLETYYQELYTPPVPPETNGSFRIDTALVIDFFRNTEVIFHSCHPFYKYLSCNVLKDMLTYFNPIMTNQVWEPHTTFQMNYKDLEPELNSLCLENSYGDDKFNVRCLLNMIILIINHLILKFAETPAFGICPKSGGEVYRYYGDPITYTNDIDTKVFYSKDINEPKIKDCQMHILGLLILLSIYIRSHHHISSMVSQIRPKNVFFGDLLIQLNFTPFEATTDVRVRSKRIADIRLFSVDAYIGMVMNLSVMNRATQTTYLQSLTNATATATTTRKATVIEPQLVMQSYTTVAPLDVANILNYSLQDTWNKRDVVLAGGVMPILSKNYLIHDIQELLASSTRQAKQEKDRNRLAFLTATLDQPMSASVAQTLNTCVVGRLSYREFYDILMKEVYPAHRDYVLRELALFWPTLEVGTDLSHKTPMFQEDLPSLDLFI